MNHLDLLPNDVMKIMNRKVQDLHIIERKKFKNKKSKNNEKKIEK